MNPLKFILDLLNINYTHKYVDKYYNEHPHKYNLLGITKMLSHYGIINRGIRVIDKELDIHILNPPFIAHVSNDFVVVHEVELDSITYYLYENKIKISKKEFCSIWSGATILVEVDENSIEPEYKKNRVNELTTEIKHYFIITGSLFLVLITTLSNQLYFNIGLLILLLLNLIGVYIGYLLVQKQLNIQSRYTDKICSIFGQNDCNDVLESSASKFMGVIGWSELGLSYFLSNTLIILFLPHLLPYLALINIATLPYTIWSIWYQKYRVGTWCPLCLIVQLLFWMTFLINLIFGQIFDLSPIFTDILLVIIIFGVPFSLISLFITKLGEFGKLERATQELNSLKANDKIFTTLLKEMPYFQLSRSSNIIFGNHNATNRITILTNPHCEPCTQMHNKIQILLKESNRYCVEYVLSSFTEELNSSNEFFIYINICFTSEERDRIYHEWFNGGKYEREKIFTKYNFITSRHLIQEHQTHIAWKEATKIRATPTVLLNGYELPHNYQIEDLIVMN